MAQGRISRGRWVFLGLLGIGVAALSAFLLMHRGDEDQAPALAGGGLYAADTPLGMMPKTLLPGMILLTPEQMVRVPLIDGFQPPIGATNGAFSYDAQGFGVMNEKRGGLHTGQDLNGIGGNDTDLGDTVYAAARGLVVFSGDGGPGWGNVVVLAHRIPGDVRTIQTLYAHLDTRTVNVGRLVGRGEPIGTLGTANGSYLAHLHFEAIASIATEAGQTGYAKGSVMNRLDPDELMAHYPAPPVPDPYTAVRRLRIREAALHDAQTAPAPAEVPEGAIPVSPTQFL